ncbi:hypothetical protein FRC09_009960 [Ceratobasidium sp. 395]|nr:hypothetical protein FRC09_009960 [Ceratobasidium sp. 395]
MDRTYFQHVVDDIRAYPDWRFRYTNVEQLRLFLQIAQSQVDWEWSWIRIDELYRILEEVSQKRNEDKMDVDTLSPPVQCVLAQFETLTLESLARRAVS